MSTREHINNNNNNNSTMDLEELKKTLEKKGYDQVQNLYKDNGINGTSVEQVIGALGNGGITCKALTNIMESGASEFKQQTGREMTYSEMRELYG